MYSCLILIFFLSCVQGCEAVSTLISDSTLMKLIGVMWPALHGPRAVQCSLSIICLCLILLFASLVFRAVKQLAESDETKVWSENTMLIALVTWMGQNASSWSAMGIRNELAELVRAGAWGKGAGGRETKGWEEV